MEGCPARGVRQTLHEGTWRLSPGRENGRQGDLPAGTADLQCAQLHAAGAGQSSDHWFDDTDDTETVTVTASSIEELLEKIKDQEQLFLSDTVKTPQEKNVGQNVDFSV